MEDILVLFQTALLAKEKEFQELCYNYYDNKGNLISNYLENGSSTDTDFKVDLEDLLDNWNRKGLQIAVADSNSYKPIYSEVCSAPTQSLLQKWLREVHKAHIYITCHSEEGNNWKCNIPNFLYKDGFSTYEEALEYGLYQLLKAI